MNNCIERKNNRVYSEAHAEKIVSFVCVIIAFFENEIVATSCRLIGAAAIAVGIFFYACAVMGGTIGALEIVFFGAAIIAASALVFKIKTGRN
ncbi:MAG: hypothetical protein ACI3XI_07640 [Eubacteriales bacterium]